MAKTDYTLNKDGKYTAIQLVSKFYGCKLEEMKGLPLKDREELARCNCTAGKGLLTRN